MIQMELTDVLYDRSKGYPVVFLREVDGARILPIWIGGAEAYAIRVCLATDQTPRPLTHELATRIFLAMGIDIEKVLVTEYKDRTFFARVIACREGERVSVDARPSDAVALAARLGRPIYVDESVPTAQIDQLETMSAKECEAALEDVLRRISPEDFGHFSSG